MTRPLMVLVSHGLDLLTFLMVVQIYGLDGEWNRFAALGLGTLLLLKTSGSLALALLVHRPMWPLTALHRYGLVPAVGAGIIGAEVNLIAYAIVRYS